MIDPTDMYWSRRLRTGVRTVLVIRIVAKDSTTTATEAQLADEVFGASGDVLNLVSGYNQCSYGQLQFKPMTNHRLLRTDGVYTLNLPNTAVIGIDDRVVAAAALDKATLDFGAQLNTLVDHVMFCLPPGTADSWVAYAYFNNWRSVYNNERCQRPSKATISICTTQMKQLWNMLISRDLW